MNREDLRSYIKKIAFVAKTPKMKVELHHSDLEKDWKGFEKNLKTKGFQREAVAHPESDEKLKKYVENYGGYVTSKKVAGVVPSRTSGKVYKLKELPNGRIGCGCKDWQFKHSVKGTDCAHIKEFKEGTEKLSASFLGQVGQGMAMVRSQEKMRNQSNRGKLIHENVRRLGTGEQLIPVGHH